MNNQSLLSKKIEDLIYLNNDHITYFQHYLGNKIAHYIYSQMDRESNSRNDSFRTNSDILSILNNYSLKGYGITHDDLEQQSLISLISGSTLSFMMGYYNYVTKGNPTVKTFEVANFRVSDIHSYINAKGLSYDFITGYRLNKDLIF